MIPAGAGMARGDFWNINEGVFKHDNAYFQKPFAQPFVGYPLGQPGTGPVETGCRPGHVKESRLSRSGMTEALTFISADIIERLENGTFTPVRGDDGPADKAGRRRTLSPLAIIKRCIRYEPYVFQHRKPLILQLARGLNRPERKIALVSGAQGIGKTSLARGLIELMGSRNEQVLWFDVNRYTDFEEIIHFLVRTIRDVFSQNDPTRTDSSIVERRADPERMPRSPGDARENGNAEAPVLAQLETLLRNVADMPLLLVLDNVEYLVDPTLRFNSAPFKEVLNFLLGFPNIKMMLLGERLPYGDMPSDPERVDDIRLTGLSEADTLIFLHARQKKRLAPSPTDSPSDLALLEQAIRADFSESGSSHSALADIETGAARQLYRKTQGAPWLLKILLHLNHQAGLDFATLNRLLDSENEPLAALTRLVDERLPDQHRALFHLLGFLRHPINRSALQAMAGICHPLLSPERLSPETLENLLEHSLLRSLVKISYPPQDVLAHVRAVRERRRENQGQNQGQSQTRTRANAFRTGGEAVGPERKFNPGYELYPALKRFVHHRLSLEEKNRIHALLRDLYLQERSREAHSRILRIKNRALLNEARFHGSLLRERPAGLFPADGGSGSPAAGVRSPAAPGLANRISAREDGLFRMLPYPYSDASPLNPPHPLGLAHTQPHNGTPGRTSGMRAAGSPFQQSLAIPLPTGRTSPLFPLSETTEEPRFPEDYTPSEPLPSDSESPSSEPPRPPTPSGALPDADHTDTPPTEEFECSRRELPRSETEPESETPGNGPAPAEPKSSDSGRPAWNPAGLAPKAEEPLRQKLDDAIDRRDLAAMAAALLELARYRSGHGQYDSARQCLQQALSLKDGVPNETRAEIYRLDGSIHKATYRHNAALADLTKAAGLIRTLMYQDDTVSAVWFGRLGKVYQDLGDIYAYRHQHAEAVDAFQQALRWYRSANENSEESEIYFQMAGLYEDLGHTEEAVAHYEKAAARDQAQGNPLSAAAALSNLGNLHLAAGSWKEAEGSFRQALEQDRLAGNADGRLNTLACLVSLHRRREEWGKAEQVARQALALAVEEGKTFWQASFYLKLGELYETLDQTGQALRHYQLARSSGGAELSGESLEWLEERIRAVDRSS
jgi:tetratricopeptide (TPR) repeat protein